MSPLARSCDGMVARVVPSDGERVLWIHGYTLNSNIWDELWSHMPSLHHIGLDLPGHGASEPMLVDEDLGRLARRIASFASELGARHLIGLSFGGMVALQVAIEAPDAFDSLILAAPALGGGPFDPEAMTCNTDLIRLYQERGVGPWLSDRWMSCPPNIFKGAAASPELFAKLREVVGSHSWRELNDSTMFALSSYSQPPNKLHTIKASTMILIGENDMEAFKRSATLIKRAIPNCRRIYLPNSGHLCLLESAQTVGKLIDAHVREAQRLLGP